MVGIKYFILKCTLVIGFLVVFACVPIQPTNSAAQYFPDLQFTNTSYQNNIKTVQLLTFRNGSNTARNNPSIELNSQESLLLTFDDLSNQQQLYQAKIIHLNKDWTKKSQVLPMNYLDGYNQIPIQDYEYSFDTKIPYIHYQFKVPPVKITGNYLLVVYKGNNEDNIVLSERFRVYENKTSVAYKIVPSSLVRKRRTMQEVEFDVRLNGANILNRGGDIYPVVKQNNNWNTEIKLNEPRFMQGEVLQYNYFDGTLNFPGFSEFRFIDISTVNFKGANISVIDKTQSPIKMLAGIDRSSASQAYREWQDNNGQFFIGNRERQTTELVNDYVDVTFQLATPQQSEPIYVIGEFNNWKADINSEMVYNVDAGTYQHTFLLKQGFYEYQYYTTQDPNYKFEGSYVDTENVYDIAIYYSNPQLRYDQLIGYTQFNSRTARQNK